MVAQHSDQLHAAVVVVRCKAGVYRFPFLTPRVKEEFA
jgi:hypothetical protein